MFSKWGYRPALDGLRVIAVYLVVIFHSGITHFSNGFIGVDLFFVLSGYLVCNVLITEMESQGTIRFTRFYARRFKRLLPAAVSLVVIVSTIFWFTVSPISVQQMLEDAKAVLLYFANFHFISDSTDYFATGDTESPFLHFWSLSIEEQFYFMFPAFIFLSLKLRFKTGKQWLPLALFGLTICLSLWFQFNAETEIGSYFGTQARVYQMLAGGALAYALRSGFINPIGGRWLVVTLPMFVVLSSSLVHVNVSQRGVLATGVVILILLGLEDVQPSWLTANPVVWLGKISYGTYLWHWPIIIWLEHKEITDTWAVLAASAVGGTLLASISYNTIEKLFREGGAKVNNKSIILGSLLISALLFMGSSSVVTYLDDNEWVQVKNDYLNRGCLEEYDNVCTLVGGENLTVHVVGDSHAGRALPMLIDWAENNGHTLSVDAFGACPWQYDLVHTTIIGKKQENCLLHKDSGRSIAEAEPDFVVLIGRPYDDDDNFDKVVSRTAEREGMSQQELVEQATRETIAEITGNGYEVILFEPIPAAPYTVTDPLMCISSGRSDCSFDAKNEPLQSEIVYREIGASNEMVHLVDMDELICPEKVCPPVLNGVATRSDSHHMSISFSETLGSEIGLLLNPIVLR